MLSNLIPNVSRHFLYSLLEHDYDSGADIINTVFRMPSEQLVEFFSSFATDLDSFFYRLDVDLKGFNKVKNEAIKAMKKPIDEDLEGFN